MSIFTYLVRLTVYHHKDLSVWIKVNNKPNTQHNFPVLCLSKHTEFIYAKTGLTTLRFNSQTKQKTIWRSSAIAPFSFRYNIANSWMPA